VSSEIVGVNGSLTVYPELVWGTKPTADDLDYVYLPVDSFGIKTAHQNRKNKPYVGGRFTKHSQAFNGFPSGSIGGKLHGNVVSSVSKSLAQFVCDLFYGSLTDNESASIGMEWAQGPDVANKAFHGMRGDQITISGDSASGVVAWAGSFVGKNETSLTTAQAVPNDLEKLVDFHFPDMTLAIASSNIGISSFQVQRSLNQKVKWVNSRTPSCIKVGDIIDTITVQLLKNAATYDAVSRLMASAGTMAEYDLDLVLKGSHNGTGTNNNTRATADIPRCCLIDPDDKLSMDDVFEQGLTFDILKPDSSTAAIAWTWDTVA